MSTIEYNLSDLITEEQIEAFVKITDKINCCGNDHLIIINDIGLAENVARILQYIENIHVDSKNKSFEVKYYNDFRKGKDLS